MQLFADENIAAQIVRQLRDAGHDVLYPPETQGRAADEIWLDKARSERRILITDDKDFGELISRDRLVSKGVILLRFGKLEIGVKIDLLLGVLEDRETELEGAFTVITGTGVRIRK